MKQGKPNENSSYPSEEWCLVVPKRDAESIRQDLLAKGILLRGAKLAPDPHDPHMLVIPLTTHMPGAVKHEVRVKPPLPPLPRHELIGSIALLAENDTSAAEEILRQRPGVQTVLYPTSVVKGPYRTKEFRLLAGIDTRDTIHTEYGKQFYINLEKAYFSARLANERQRIVSVMKKGERVLDMSAGVGPFCVMLAPLASVMYGVDINPSAIALLHQNLLKNRVNNVIPILGDSMHLNDFEFTPFDRVIINMPLDATRFFPVATLLCRPGGIIHWYVLAKQEGEYIDFLSSMGFKKIAERRVRSYAPDKFHSVYEITV
jgi:tRNA (guanine37-N1)-methyltransferase